MTQTALESRLDELQLGDPYTTFDATHEPIDSYELEGGDAVPSIGLVQGTLANQAKVPTAGGTFLGVLLARKDRARDGLGGSPLPYVAGKDVQLLTRGRAVVTSDTATTKGGLVYLVSVGGTFRNDATGATLVPGATWFTTTTVAGAAVIKMS